MHQSRRALRSLIVASALLIPAASDANVGMGMGMGISDVAVGTTGPIVCTTWNPSNTDSSIALSNGDSTATSSSAGNWKSTIATGSGKTSGKWYFRVKLTIGGSEGNFYVGGAFTESTSSTSTLLGNDANGWMGFTTPGGAGPGGVWHNGASVGSFPTLATSGDYEVVVYDATNSAIYFTVMTAGGVLNTNWNDTSADPATNTGGIATSAGMDLQPGASFLDNNLVGTLDTTTVISDPTLSGFLPYDSGC